MLFDVHPVIAVVQVRMTSSRLPGKVLKPLAGAPLIRRMIERVLRIDGIDGVAVALAEGAANDPVIDALSGMNVTIVRGSESDVLARSAAAARAAGAQTVMRITSDCPLLDPAVSAAILAAYEASHSAGLRYARTSAESGFPHGLTPKCSTRLLFTKPKPGPQILTNANMPRLISGAGPTPSRP